jgi:hypothetical protein
MSVPWIVHSDSDPRGLGGSTILGPVSSPQSMYVSDSVIEEKVSQGAKHDWILVFLFTRSPESKMMYLVVPRAQRAARS